MDFSINRADIWESIWEKQYNWSQLHINHKKQLQDYWIPKDEKQNSETFTV